MTQISRRSFFIMVAATVAGGQLASDAGRKPRKPGVLIFDEIHRLPASPTVAAREFVRARSERLMALYSVFFPRMIEVYGKDTPRLVAEAADEERKLYPKDHHRLDALPAVAAAHVLAHVNTDEDREELTSVLVETLQKDSRREVREIILQNLISSTRPDFDTLRFLVFKSSLLSALDQIISDSLDDDLLTSPLCLLADLLMNYRAIVRVRSGDRSEFLRAIEGRLDKLLSLPAPHFEYPRRVIATHPSLNRSTVFMHEKSQPPQRSEALIGSQNRGFVSVFRPWLRESALIQARNTYLVYQVAAGKRAPTESMTRDQAHRALPKGLSFLKYHTSDLLPLGVDARQLNLPRDETGFRNFLERLPRLQDRYSMREFRPSEVEEALSECVPFGQFRWREAASRMASQYRREFEHFTAESTLKALTRALTTATGLDHFAKLCRVWELETPKPDSEGTWAVSEEAIDAVLEEVEAADKIVGEALDEREAELGPPVLMRGVGESKRHSKRENVVPGQEVASRTSNVFHLSGLCKDAERIKDSNLVTGREALRGRRLHHGCPR